MRSERKLKRPQWKYDIGDTVWFNAWGRHPTRVTVTGLTVLGDGSPAYQLREADGGYVNQSEDRVYASPEAARTNIR